MKALTVVPGTTNSAQLQDVEDPPASDGPVLVETLAVGICGTDIEILSGAYGWAPPGKERLILGHESLGKVLEAPVGSGVAPGDLVVGIVRRPDPVPCANCAVGEWDFCRNGQYTERGIKQHDGYLSERYRITPEFVVKVDPALGILGVLFEPASVVAKAWEQIQRIGSRAHWAPKKAVVTGAGPIGLLAALLGVQAGLEVHVIDQMETGTKPDLVRAIGAQYHTGTIADVCPDADAIVECTGVSSLVLDAVEHVGTGGVVCLTGVSSGGRSISVDEGAINRQMVLSNEAVVGSVNANRRHYEAGADALAKADRSWLEGVANRRVPLESWKDALDRKPDDVKVVVQVGRRVSAGHGAHDHPPSDGGGAAGPTRQIAPGVVEIDTLLGGWRRVTAGYLIEGAAPVLVETGSQSSVPSLLASLEYLGLGAHDLAGVVVTHIHLDHAGGVGDVASAFPNATVYVHEKGARHLADPTKLVESASRVYGPLLDSLYGRLAPTPTERLHVLLDEETIEVSPGRTLTAVDSPGHAKHHLGLMDSESGILFAGDAVGVKLPDGGVLRPSTPPPDFDLDQALGSLSRFAAHRPSAIALAHYGLLPDPEELLQQAAETLRDWASVAERAFAEGSDIAEALAKRFDPEMGDLEPEHKEKLDIMNGVHSNAAGLARWLEQRTQAGNPPD